RSAGLRQRAHSGWRHAGLLFRGAARRLRARPPAKPRAMSVIQASFRMRLGEFSLNAELSVPAQGVTAVFGASGSGKTTLLRCMAGLARAPAGFFAVDGEIWQDEARGTFVPPHQRACGYVFQDANLFPHLSVGDNLRYGYRRVPE